MFGAPSHRRPDARRHRTKPSIKGPPTFTGSRVGPFGLHWQSAETGMNLFRSGVSPGPVSASPTPGLLAGEAGSARRTRRARPARYGLGRRSAASFGRAERPPGPPGSARTEIMKASGQDATVRSSEFCCIPRVLRTLRGTAVGPCRGPWCLQQN